MHTHTCKHTHVQRPAPSPRIVTAPWQFPVDFMLVENREREREEAEIETNDHGNREWGTNRGQDRERVEEVQEQKCRDTVHGREWKGEGEKKRELEEERGSFTRWTRHLSATSLRASS